MCTNIQRFANTGLVNISTANSNLNGTGALGTVLTAPAFGFQGTKINSITVKATGNTTQGMVRLFVFDGANNFLWKEINVPENFQTGVIQAFQTTLYEELDLLPGQVLKASTENAESFNVYANGVDWNNCECVAAPTCSSMQISYNTGIAQITIANSNLNGTGAIGTVLTAPVGALVYGSQMHIVNIKATQTTTEGMVRLFLDDSVTKFLIWEIPIPACTQTAVEPAYRTQFQAFAIDLKAGYSLCASTENAEAFNITVCAENITNCEC